ncbi:MAG: ABC transporter substrate-binding protein [Christensenellales bacterium]|jgi:peptide/nickel transport system substrate-binding protein
MKKRLKTAGALWLAFILILCIGCGMAQEPPAEPTPAPMETWVPVEDGHITIGMPENLGRSHPLFPGSREMVSIHGLMFEGLFRLDESGKPQPNLAESYSREETEDGYRWTFQIRKNVKWHGNNGALSASDVKFTLDTLLQAEESFYKGNVAGITEVETQADAVILLTDATVSYTLLERLTFPIVPKRVYEEQGEDQADPKPVGSGPFEADVFDVDVKIELVRNASWWREGAKLASITIESFHDYETVWNRFRQGDVDMALCDRITAASFYGGDQAQIIDVRSRTLDMLVPNLSHDFLSDESVRRAIAYAVHTNEVIIQVYLNRGTPVNLPLAADNWLSDVSLHRYDFDPYMAGALLRQAGFTADEEGILHKQVDGENVRFELTIATNAEAGDALREDTAALLARQLRAVGIDASVETMALQELEDKVQSGDYDMALCGVVMGVPLDFPALYGADGAANLNGFSSPDIESALSALPQAQSPEDYRESVISLCSRVLDHQGTIPLYYRQHTLLTSRRVAGVKRSMEPFAFFEPEQWTVRNRVTQSP